ncbi:MAG: hypothetical protein AB8B60_19445 [Sulfitobacter sp.]
MTLPDVIRLIFRCITLCWIGLVPSFALAEIPMPIRSNSAFLEAESIVLCSDFEEINASRVTQFLENLDRGFAIPEILDGPETPVKVSTFNVLVVISGKETTRYTLDCASDVAPYDIDAQQEVMIAVQRLKQGFEHPNPTINAALGDTQWASSNFYHEAENWVTIVISMLEPSAYNLNYTMIRLFDLPDVICEQNSACIDR